MKFVYESLDTLFKSKTEDEIMNSLEREYPLGDDPQKFHNNPTNFLRAGILRDDIHFVKHALKHGAKIFDDNTNYHVGNLWAAFNDYDFSKVNGEKIIIEMLKHIDILLKNNEELQQTIVERCIYYGLTVVLEWILTNYGQYLDPFDINAVSHSPSTFRNNHQAHIIINNWLDKNDNREES